MYQRFCTTIGCSPLETDTHWRAKKGKASFNWRLLFDVELGHSTRAMKFPYLHLQLWDRDILKWNDCAGEGTIDIGRYYRKAYKRNIALKLFETKKGAAGKRAAKKKDKFSKCGRCEAITYCSRECQAEDWPRHKNNCVPVMIAEVGKKGLVAAKDIKMGEQILIDSVAISMMRKPIGGVVTRKFAQSFRDQIQGLPEEKATQFNDLSVNDSITLSERNLKTLRKENCLGEMKIFLSNRIEIEKEDLDVLFYVLSLINHSCSPNVEECTLPRESEDQEKVEEYELRSVKGYFKG